MEIDSRHFSLKLRGFLEQAEESVDLQIFMANWIASVIAAEPSIAPTVPRTYCLGTLEILNAEALEIS